MTRAQDRSLPVVLEIVLFFFLIQAYVWRWQFTHRELAWPLLIGLFASHVWHRDTLYSLGFRLDNFVPAFRSSALASLPFLLVLGVIGVVNRQSWIHLVHRSIIFPAFRYMIWAVFQQYGLQGVFHRRIRYLTKNRWLSAAMSGIIFMSLHFPNPVLMTFTLLGGFVLSWIYVEQPNLFALGISQGLLGLLVSSCLPKELLHNMRVGPGYFR